MVLLVCGTLLAHGRRTVTAVLKMLGLADEHNWSKYHNLLNRAKYSDLAATAIMLRLLVKTFLAPNAPIEIVMDETLERRWGRKIKKRGHWRDSLASSHQQNVTASGLRWLVAALVVKLPWSNRRWALPFFSTILTTPKRSVELKLRHRTVTGRTSQLVMWLYRLFKGTGRTIKLIGDRAYSVIELGLLCQKLGIVLLAPIRMDARLFEPPPSRQPHTIGRPRRVGKRLPLLGSDEIYVVGVLFCQFKPVILLFVVVGKKPDRTWLSLIILTYSHFLPRDLDSISTLSLPLRLPRLALLLAQNFLTALPRLLLPH